MEPIKDYIGDGVYVSWDGYDVVVYLDNGCGPYNEIHLEPVVLQAFNRFQERIKYINPNEIPHTGKQHG